MARQAASFDQGRRRIVLLGAAAAILIGVIITLVWNPARGESVAASPEGEVAEAIAVARDQRMPPRSLDELAPSVIFPPGLSYRQAVARLFMAEVTGEVAHGWRLGPPLPKGRVAVIPNGNESVQLSLSAPWGYDPKLGLPAGLPLEMPEGLSAEPQTSARGPWLAGSAVPIPVLPSCMVLTDSADETPADCRDDDQPYIDDREIQSVPLP